MRFRIFQRGGPGPADSPPAAPDAPGAWACLVCGGARAEAGVGPAPCALCGRTAGLAERCRSGHAVCAACLAGPTGEVVERACAATGERDPVAIAERITRHPVLRLLPDDHDLLVPAALAAAWSNVRGEGDLRAARVREVAVRMARGSAAPRRDGEGAASGAGVFVSLAVVWTGRPDPALADRAAARAATLIGRGDDALCSRRNALVAILATARLAREQLGVDLPARGLACERAGKNPTCIGAACPFNRT